MALGDYQNNMAQTRNYSVSSLPIVNDPEKVYADISRQDFDSYLKDYRGFEEKLIASRNDTSLVDRAPGDIAKQNEIAAGVQQRNLSRYGGAGLSIAQRQQQQAGLQRQGQLGLAGGLNTSRIAQREVNQRTLSELINIGQGVNRTANQGLATASENAAQKASAYKNAKAAHSSQMMGMGAQIGSLALMAFAI
jgi:hypothetical protein